MADHFYRRWILANAVAEMLGLGTTFLLGFQTSQAMHHQPGPGAILVGTLAVIVLGIALEGVFIGIAQGWALRERVPTLSLRNWTIATAIGAGMAWVLGMVPSTTIALLWEGEEQASQAAPTEFPTWLQYSLATLMGLLLGPILGLAQVQVLRRYTTNPYRWLWANAAAWAIGMPLIFAGMDLVPWDSGPAAITLSILVVCGVTGAAVGAVHGWYLKQVLLAVTAA